jgi:hypothetical protein
MQEKRDCDTAALGRQEDFMRQSLITCSIVIATLIATSCDDYTIADKAKMDACASGVVLTKADYDQLKREAEFGKSVGRYQIHREGARTWRLDTATGHICLMLTTTYDWEHDAKDQSNCAIEDALNQRQH